SRRSAADPPCDGDEQDDDQPAPKQPPARRTCPPGRGPRSVGRGPRNLGCGRSAAEPFAQSAEEILRQLLRCPLDQPRSDLRELAADVDVGAVAQPRAALLVLQIDPRLAPGETGRTALTRAGNRVAAVRVDLAQRYFRTEGGADRADGGAHARAEVGVGLTFQRLAAGNAGAQHFGIVERLPDHPAVGRYERVAFEYHVLPSPAARALRICSKT